MPQVPERGLRHRGDARDLAFVAGNPTRSPVVRVRDMLVVPTSMAEGDPVAEPWAGDPAVDLGRDLWLTAVDHGEGELVLDACTSRGHFFVPLRQFGVCYALSLDLDPAVYQGPRSYGFDSDGVVITAMQLSRLVRDNAYSPEFAARVVDHEDGEQQIVPQGQHYQDFLPSYRLRNDRDWLNAADATELRALLDAYWANMGHLPDRVHRAISLSEGVVHTRIIERALNFAMIGLESLLNTNRQQVTRQMVARIPLLAREVGVPGVTTQLADEMYDHRSRAAHGAQVPLPPATPTPQAAGGGHIDAAYLAKVALMQDVLRVATRKAVAEPQFAAVLASDAAIRARWPVVWRGQNL